MFENIPEIADKYDSFELLSEGGQGSVYRARHRFLDEVRVIKTIHEYSAFEHAHQRFLNEARIAAKLRHPNIATVHDFIVTTDEQSFLVMEYIEGDNLWDLFEKGQRFSQPLIGLWAQQTLDALDYLHSENFVHRDMALDNVMMTSDRRGNVQFKLIDLGIAKSLDGVDYKTSTGVALGKVLYISPEALRHGSGSTEVDHRSDLYSFGVVLYKLLTGQLPISGSDQPSLIAGHLYQPPRSFDETDPEGRLADPLRAVLMQAVDKDKLKRPQSASELARELARVLPPAPPGPLQVDSVLDAPTRQIEAGETGSAPAHSFVTVAPGAPERSGPAAPIPEPDTPETAAPPAAARKASRTRPNWPLALAGVAIAAAAMLAAPFVVPLITSEAATGPAVSDASRTAARDPAAESLAPMILGEFHALIIGNDHYEKLPPLETAINDARSVAEVLENRYRFKVTLVEDASRSDLLEAIRELETRLSARDNLLVYYAGHGDLLAQREYWQPIDADPRDPTNWVSTEHDISARLDELPVRHLLIVADSCYAGSVGRLDATDGAIDELVRRQSRLLMTSGSNSPIVDDSGGRHSIFARVMLDTLRSNDRALQADQLFATLADRVPAEAARLELEQIPTFAAMPQSLDEGGMFFFVPRFQESAGY